VINLPKAKPTQVIVHRIELQESEREMVELAMLGNVATNAVSAAGAVLSGIGSFLAPFSGVFGAFAALWIGDRTLDIVREDAEARKAEIEAEYAESKSEYDTIISAWLNARYAEGGWRAVCSGNSRQALLDGQSNVPSNYGDGLGSQIPGFYFTQLMRFLTYVCDEEFERDVPDHRRQSPSELWVLWMSEEEYGQAAYYADTGGSVWAGLEKGLGTIL
jgi:hypothetical protein